MEYDDLIYRLNQAAKKTEDEKTRDYLNEIRWDIQKNGISGTVYKYLGEEIEEEELEDEMGQ